MDPQNIIDLLSVRIPWVFLGQKRRPVFLNTRTTPSLFKRTRVLSENTTFSQKPSIDPAKIQNKNASESSSETKTTFFKLTIPPNLANENASKVVQKVPPLIFSVFKPNIRNRTRLKGPLSNFMIFWCFEVFCRSKKVLSRVSILCAF